MSKRNEAADELRASFEPHEALWVKDMLDKALATERHNAVERLKNEALAIQWQDDHGNEVVALDALLMALDEYEAEGSST